MKTALTPIVQDSSRVLLFSRVLDPFEARVSANRALVPEVRVDFEKRLILGAFPVRNPVVCEASSVVH